ncbi:MAG: bifunctional 5,10-methylenetetrahydrofolate dehydrogenase/5,10-methenyltetrahydrofolate cyclohydrolase [Candidatus Saccharibacteria bacterium]
MKLLDGLEVADYIKERHIRQSAGLVVMPKLVIFHDAKTPAGAAYLRAKQQYGEDIGVEVVVSEIATEDLMGAIEEAGADDEVTGIIVQLPLADAAYTEKALAAIPHHKDVDGLRSQDPYQSATAKGIIWLLAAYNVELKAKRIAVVGQGKLVGAPLSDILESSGYDIDRIDIDSHNMANRLLAADIIISATGKPEHLTSSVVKDGAIIIDTGSPLSELAPDLAVRRDITKTPNPGGVGPMTVVALFDNVLLAAGV